jgi:hypothetical protein
VGRPDRVRLHCRREVTRGETAMPLHTEHQWTHASRGAGEGGSSDGVQDISVAGAIEVWDEVVTGKA